MAIQPGQKLLHYELAEQIRTTGSGLQSAVLVRVGAHVMRTLRAVALSPCRLALQTGDLTPFDSGIVALQLA
jgi:hypothetical protein